MKPLTDDELEDLVSQRNWTDLAERIRQHCSLCEPLLPQVLAALSPTLREEFTLLFLKYRPFDGPVH